MSILVTSVIIASVAVGGVGIKKGYNAHCNNNEAERLNELGYKQYNDAVSCFNKQREDTEKALEALGKLKIDIWANDLKEFQEIFKCFKNVKFNNEGLHFSESLGISDPENIKDMELSTINAAEIASGLAGSTAIGVLSGVAAYGGAMGLASASTGTAIATLSGIAAKNATLAWFGGGALSVGGMGVAGGTLVLGGIVVGPTLLASGYMIEAKSEENLARAKANFEKNKYEVQKVETMKCFMNSIEIIADDYKKFIFELRKKFGIVVRNIAQIKKKYTALTIGNRVMRFLTKSDKVDFQNLDIKEKQQLHIAVLMAQILHGLMKTSVLVPDCDGQDSRIDENAVKILNNTKNVVLEIEKL